jgi:hypothetical protein
MKGHYSIIGRSNCALRLGSAVSKVLLIAVTFCVPIAIAQYPRVPDDVRIAAVQKAAEVDRHSDEAWQKALPIVREWEQKGKPYIPWAAKLQSQLFPAHKAVGCTASVGAAEGFSS